MKNSLRQKVYERQLHENHLMNYLIAAILFISSQSLWGIDFKKCPSGGQDYVPYNHMNPAKAVFVSTKFEKAIAPVIKNHEPDLTIYALKDLESPYIQDGFEIAYNPVTKSPAILQPDHPDGTGAPRVAKLLGMDIDIYGYDAYSDVAPGNLEGLPGGLTLMGNQMIENGPIILDTSKVLYMDTRGTSAHHVDQIFTIVPHRIKRQNNLCPFTVFYSSPQAALKLLNELPDRTQLQVKLTQNRLRWFSGLSADNCLQKFSLPIKGRNNVTAKQAKECKPFIENLKQVENIRTEQKSKLKKFLEEKLKCDVEILGLPYFATKRVALSPNPVNALVLNKTMIIGKQASSALEVNLIETISKATGFKVDFVDDRAYHFGSGNVHCITNVLRSCQ